MIREILKREWGIMMVMLLSISSVFIAKEKSPEIYDIIVTLHLVYLLAFVWLMAAYKTRSELIIEKYEMTKRIFDKHSKGGNQ